MEFRNKQLSFAEAKAIDMVAYLAGLGHNPAKTRGTDIWYLSPLRIEGSPSFKVNTRINRWYDFGIGKGGSIIDFGMAYYNCTLHQFMQQLAGHASLSPASSPIPQPLAPEPPKMQVSGNGPIKSLPLLQYLTLRGIPLSVAGQFCCEVSYRLGEKFYYGIGFRNNSGGFEIRNPYYKTSSSPKDITLIENGSSDLCVFEGFFDFLSFQVLFSEQAIGHDHLILNSLAFVDRALPLLETYKSGQLYLDSNQPGREASGLICSLMGKAWTDRFLLYKGYEDLNDYLCQKPVSLTVPGQKNAIPP